jgi:D-alanyl-D-alanine-carboxypeptidase/D-alanyl-D-alanine-endopeptidase
MNINLILPVLCLSLLPISHASAVEKNSLQEIVDQLTSGQNPYRGVAAIRYNGLTVDFVHSGVDKISQDSIVEIGSVTKVFTSLLLAIGSQKSKLNLNQSINQSFGEELLRPELNASVTLKQLSQQASGLPRLADNLPAIESENPYLGFNLNLMKDYIRSLEWRNPPPADCILSNEKDPNDYSDIIGHTIRRPATCYNYSNIGVTILGHAVARTFESKFEDAIAAEITSKLALKDTVFELSAEQLSRKITGHDAAAKPVTEWSREAVIPSGGLKSTPSEMIQFLKLFLAQSQSLEPILQSSARLTLSTVDSIPTAEGIQQMGLGWHIFEYNGRKIYWHNGGTNGFLSFAAIDLQKSSAVFFVANHSLDGRLDEAGMQALLHP